MNHNQRNELLADKDRYEKESALLDALQRLQVNPDFRKIYEHYTKDHASLLIQRLSPLVKEGKNTDTINQQLESISHFMAFLTTIEINGNSANESLNQIEV